MSQQGKLKYSSSKNENKNPLTLMSSKPAWLTYFCWTWKRSFEEYWHCHWLPFIFFVYTMEINGN